MVLQSNYPCHDLVHYLSVVVKQLLGLYQRDPDLLLILRYSLLLPHSALTSAARELHVPGKKAKDFNRIVGRLTVSEVVVRMPDVSMLLSIYSVRAMIPVKNIVGRHLPARRK